MSSPTAIVPAPINSSTAAAFQPHSDNTRERVQESDRPTLEDVLAEIDPLLESVDERRWRDFVRHTVFQSFENKGAHPPSCPKSPEGRRWRGTDKHHWDVSHLPPLNDVRWDTPPLPSEAYTNCSIPALVELVSILQLTCPDTDSNNDWLYNEPVGNVIYSIGKVEIEIRKSMDAANRHALDQRLSYMCQLVEVLIDAGARKIPYGRSTLLHTAAECQSVCMVKRFLDLVFVVDHWKKTPLHSAVRICHFDLIFSGFLDIVTMRLLKRTGVLARTMQYLND